VLEPCSHLATLGWRRRWAVLLAAELCPLGASGPSLAADAAATRSASLPEVVVTAPMPGADLSLSEVPANVQRVTASQLGLGHSQSAADALEQWVGSVNVNDTQANPFQPDVNFRGFTGSPILGTPQGVSVFVDGVRINESFGDAVNWELIPQCAIASLEVTPGSNPVFGLNTLGGALAITTKRGLDFPGSAIELQGGSFGRRVAEIDSGGHGKRLDYFVAGNFFDDEGWGDHNPSRVRQGFGKLGYRDGANDITLSMTYANSSLEGNQTLPQSFLSSPLQAYTWPDVQRDEMAFADLNASHRLSDAWSLSAKIDYRKVSTGVLNSNVNDDFDPASSIGEGNEPTGNLVEQIDQYRSGAAAQLVGRSTILGHRNTFIAGAALNHATTNFLQYGQEAASSRDTSSNAPLVLGTRLHAGNRAAGIYFSDTFELAARAFLNLAGRYNDAAVTLEDRLGTALNGHHAFVRFNPALGMTFNPSRSLTVYGRYEEGMRAPTPVELTCADPNAPCSLPNAFSADPPLKAVIAKTFEVGGRGSLNANLSITAALFRTNLDDDLQFLSSGGGAVSAGYFRNVGQTRRQGVEIGADAKSGRLLLSAHYTYLSATFETPLVLNSPNHSAAVGISCPTCTEIQVSPGDRIPGLPRHVFKLRAQYESGVVGVGVTTIGQSNQFARGDENNRDVNGPLPGYMLVNLDAHLELDARWSLFARVDNLFDRRYYTFATLGQNVFTGPGNSFDATGGRWRAEQFRGVGVPRGAWLGVSYRLGGSEAR
jgi:iron complex outermembrane recepter protein